MPFLFLCSQRIGCPGKEFKIALIKTQIKNSKSLTGKPGFLAIPIFTFSVICLMTLALSGQNVKQDMQALKATNNDQEFIRLALEMGQSYLEAGQWESAFDFFSEAEKKGRKFGGVNAQNVVMIASCEVMINCCYQENRVKSALFRKLEDLIDRDKNKLLQPKIMGLIHRANQEEKDSEYLGQLYAIVKPYLSATDYDRLKSENGLAIETEKMKESLAIGEGKKDSLERNLSMTSIQLNQVNVVKDSMSNELFAKDGLIKNVEYKLFLDSLMDLRREDLLNQQLEIITIKQKANDRMRIALIALAASLLLISFFLYKIWSYSKMIKKEKARSEELLLNILPSEIARELKDNGKVETDYYEHGNIMFVDFVGFSQIAKLRSPKELVADLNDCFMALDELALKFGVEKIKTIGDAYMCVTGIPVPSENDTDRLVQFGFAIIQYLHDWNQKRKTLGLIPFEARLGIHTGPLAAGVVGKHKFCFDVWGDTVNIASRLESAGKAGTICISEATRSRLGNSYDFESIGMVGVKNMQPIEMLLIHEKKVAADGPIS